MFGMGGSEILVILIVALLFLGPDKLPDAAKKISKGIRDIKKQSRILQRTIEDDEHIGGAIRDLRSALRGEDEPIRPKPVKPKEIEAAPTPDPVPPALAEAAPPTAAANAPDAAALSDVSGASSEGGHLPPIEAASNGAHGAPADAPKLTLPPTAGEPALDPPAAAAHTAHQDAELAQLVKPAPNTIARGAAPAPEPAPAGSAEPSETENG